ncbi:glycosyltransferase family 2 protein [Marinobacter sp. LV10MA510-1]|uniref:glycosyltransferase family 2 protein n=1 Tax=Marinobacter sp. LV10MA510-1 TaxID=1415567 RepID=UPI000BF3029E|nr:glycosyltransferase family 2 protein [Marinobacter sp. LV10MA510-1]PFG09251.1 glycosyltransferase involved in cell wall biosynthesis [Marinobacter sp. LV10MA510-1]
MAALSSNKLKVSIITVCFNSESTIRDTLDSVRSQNYENIEHIIVDGGSSDRTMDIVTEYREWLGPVVSESDKGLYDAMNKGIGMASGDIIGILNSDDFYESTNVIEVAVAVFLSDPDLDILFGDVVFVNSEDLDTITRFYRAGHFRPWKLRFGWMPPHPATFVTKAVYEKHGKYRLDMKISADYEMFVRWLSKAKLKYIWVDRVIVRMRAGGVSTGGLKSSLILNKEIVRACKENGLYTNLMLVLTKIPFKCLELLRLPKRVKD